MKNIYLLILVLFTAVLANAQVYNYEDGEAPPRDQDSISGFTFGFNIGYYFANPATAVLYDGSGFDRDGNRYTDLRNFWLYRAIYSDIRGGSNDQVDPAIVEILDPATFVAFTESDMPFNMRYGPSFMYGAHVGYSFTGNFSMFFEVNGTNPVTVSEFTIQVNPGASADPSPDNLRRFQIRGEEQRLIFNLGAKKTLGNNEFFRPYLEGGVNSTFAKFESNVINLESSTNNFVPPLVKDITRYQTNIGGNIEQARNLTGVGFGAFAGLGGQLTMGDKFILNLGYIASYEQVKLGYVESRNFQHIIVLRVIYTNAK